MKSEEQAAASLRHEKEKIEVCLEGNRIMHLGVSVVVVVVVARHGGGEWRSKGHLKIETIGGS